MNAEENRELMDRAQDMLDAYVQVTGHACECDDSVGHTCRQCCLRSALFDEQAEGAVVANQKLALRNMVRGLREARDQSELSASCRALLMSCNRKGITADDLRKKIFDRMKSMVLASRTQEEMLVTHAMIGMIAVCIGEGVMNNG